METNYGEKKTPENHRRKNKHFILVESVKKFFKPKLPKALTIYNKAEPLIAYCEKTNELPRSKLRGTNTIISIMNRSKLRGIKHRDKIKQCNGGQ